jgi:polyhydroxyalkanoate synthesis repressor PhaR
MPHSGNSIDREQPKYPFRRSQVMVRLIKRYESRKLYDTEESRYVSLDEIAEWVREGQEIRVVDNANSEDVTAQTLAQIILGEGRDGVMHDLVRFGEKALTTGVEQVQQGVDRVVRASIDKLGPVRQAREEMKRLRSRLEELETSLVELEKHGLSTTQARTKTVRSTSTAKKKTAKKATATSKTKARSA